MNISVKKRLSKMLAAAGVASRRACEELIFAGKVKVNGETVLIPQTMVGPEDHVIVQGEKVSAPEEKLYFILNKPKGYLCTAKRTNQSKIVLDLFEDVEERLFTAGRLDKNTEGLIIITNDGHFANRVIHPSSNLQKEYLVKTDKEVTHEHLLAINRGTLVEGIFVKPIRVTKVRKGTLKITVTEGKKHEVRLLLENAGLHVRELTRIRIGGLHLGSLKIGQWRNLSAKEQESIFA
jgi:23S rRNA pseudouridine2605 synthase